MRFLAVLLALVLFALPLPATHAASFDCARAETDLETAICSYELLSAADEVLATAYATAIGGLSKAATNVMRTGQRQWLDHAAYVCIERARDEAIETPGDCLLGLFNDRIATLEGSRMLSGHRFYLSTDYAALPDPQAEADSYWQTATHELALPLIDAEGDLAAGFNAVMQALPADYGWPADGDFDPGSDTGTDITLLEAFPNRITTRADYYWYGHGAAHGNYSIEFLHYLPQQQRLLTASDVFSGDDWRETLLDLTVSALRAEHGDNLMLDDPQAIAETVADPRRWRFDTYGLVIQFQPYEVSAYAYGAPTATVKWQDLEGFMAETADAIRWGY
jgi:uncharacterized protein YecT (DUF1311 family)